MRSLYGRILDYLDDSELLFELRTDIRDLMDFAVMIATAPNYYDDLIPNFIRKRKEKQCKISDCTTTR